MYMLTGCLGTMGEQISECNAFVYRLSQPRQCVAIVLAVNYTTAQMKAVNSAVIRHRSLVTFSRLAEYLPLEDTENDATGEWMETAQIGVGKQENSDQTLPDTEWKVQNIALKSSTGPDEFPPISLIASCGTQHGGLTLRGDMTVLAHAIVADNAACCRLCLSVRASR